MSCGKVFAGLLSIKLSNNISLISLIGMISHVVAYYLSFLYIPSSAIMHDTWDVAYLEPCKLTISSLNRYTTDEKSSLHTWRGARAPFRSAQLLIDMNNF